MNARMRGQRGEGKVGCIISFLVLAILTAVAIKVVPAYYADNQIYDIVERKAEQASGRKAEDMEKEIRIEIRSIGVPEALAPRAITVRKNMSGDAGNVTVTIKYSHKVDLYGMAEWPINIDKTLVHPVLEGIK